VAVRSTTGSGCTRQLTTDREHATAGSASAGGGRGEPTIFYVLLCSDKYALKQIHMAATILLLSTNLTLYFEKHRLHHYKQSPKASQPMHWGLWEQNHYSTPSKQVVVQQTNSWLQSRPWRTPAAHTTAGSTQPHRRLCQDFPTQGPEPLCLEGFHFRHSTDFVLSPGLLRQIFCLCRQALLPWASAGSNTRGAGTALPRDTEPAMGKGLPPAPGKGRSGSPAPIQRLPVPHGEGDQGQELVVTQ